MVGLGRAVGCPVAGETPKEAAWGQVCMLWGLDRAGVMGAHPRPDKHKLVLSLRLT